MSSSPEATKEIEEAAEAGIVAGAIVRLKSGGPKMTVEAVDVYTYSVSARCLWFDGNKQQSELFKPATLTVVNKD